MERQVERLLRLAGRLSRELLGADAVALVLRRGDQLEVLTEGEERARLEPFVRTFAQQWNWRKSGRARHVHGEQTTSLAEALRRAGFLHATGIGLAEAEGASVAIVLFFRTGRGATPSALRRAKALLRILGDEVHTFLGRAAPEASAEEDVAEQARFFRDTLPIGLAEVVGGRIASINAFLTRLLGGREEVVGRPVETVIAGPDRKEFRGWLGRLVGGTQPEPLRVRLRRAGGDTLPAEVRGVVQAIGPESPVWLLFLDRRRLASAESEREELIRKAAAFQEVLGLALADADEREIAARVLERVAAELRADAGRVVAFSLRDGRVETLAECSMSGAGLPAANPPGWWVYALPGRKPYVLDTRKRSRGAPDWVLQVLERGCRRCFCAPLGCGGRTIGALLLFSIREDAFGSEDRAWLEQAAGLLALALERAEFRRVAEDHFQNCEPDRSRELAEKTAELERLNAALLNLLEDLRAVNRRLEQTTRDLLRSNEDLKSFVTTVSHDLRAPLRAIQGFTEAAMEETGDILGEEASVYLRRSLEAARRMDELIEDLLEYSRLGTMRVEVAPVDLDEVVDEVLAIHQAGIRKSEAVLDVARPLGRILGHDRVLVQVLSNLVSNALKFVKPGEKPVVHIRSETRGGVRRVWVEDRGIGIPAEHRERIFGVFERLHGIETYPGTGVGLAIVRRGLERMGGSVGVESTPGAGSRFWIELPLPSDEPSADADAPHRAG